jgi:predicted Rossmann fold nucleotide-binding protein DprA/Smf involved in DNA uptake
MKVMPEKIVSGGQTGTDRAALDVAMKHIIETGGWCPAGRRAEDGVIPDCYQLTETKARNYATRTKRNVRESDGTLVLNLGELDGGTLQTVEYAEKRGKPCLVVQLDDAVHPDPQEVAEWLKEQSICVLNVAGPRESKRSGIYRQSFGFLDRLLKE